MHALPPIEAASIETPAQSPHAVAGGEDTLYREIFRRSPVEVHIWEVVRDDGGGIVNWRLVDANPVALAAWGMELGAVVGRTTDEIFGSRDPVDTFLPLVTEIIESGEPQEWETPFDSTGQILRMVSFPVGERFVSTGFDVTDLRTSQRGLQDALYSLQEAVRAGDVGLWDWDLRTNRVRYSDEWKRQLGYGPDEIADTFEEWESRVHPDDLPGARAATDAAIASARDGHQTLVRMRHRDGSWRWILARASFVLDEDGRPVRMLGSHLDITDRKRLEDRVVETQKLEAIGTLAAGIAHDFNNLLSAIVGNLSLIEVMGLDDPEAASCLGEVERAAERAQGLTTQLLTFSKGGAPVREVASIQRLIRESATFVTRGSRSTCRVFVADDLSNVVVDLDQLSQVITNLVINADQAMPQGGVIEVRATNERLPRENRLGLEPGRYVHVSVRDEGPGIPEEALARIFEPFYTTKATGSGLGLSTSHSIIAAHGGLLTVDSTTGEGTMFSVFLPASDDEVTGSESRAVVRGSGRILVMDDEEAVRTVTRRTLEHVGYDCDEAIDGDEALDMYRAARDAHRPYDAVILDLTLPGKPGGHRVLSRLREIDPEVVAILNSGYAEDDIVANYDRWGFRGRLRKPVDARTLSMEVARVLQDD